MDEIGNTALSYLSYDSSKPILDLTESILSRYPYELFSKNINDETCLAYAFASPRTYNGKDIGFLEYLLLQIQAKLKDENITPCFNYRLTQWEYSFYIQFRMNPDGMHEALKKAKEAVAQHEIKNAQIKPEDIGIISFETLFQFKHKLEKVGEEEDFLKKI